jgi:hypothetical protein
MQRSACARLLQKDRPAMAEDADNARATDVLWQYLFALRSEARAGNWEALRHLLAQEAQEPLTSHPFALETFHFAANAGQADIVEMLLHHGLSLESETLSDTVRRLALYYTAAAQGVLRLLVSGSLAADAGPAVLAAASAGRLDALQALDAAGADVRAGESGFFLALYGGHPAAMHYLHEKGAGLYHPAVIAAQYGRRAELPGEKAEAVIAVYHDLVSAGNERFRALYADAGKPRDVQALREKTACDGDGFFTRLHLAVRAEAWGDVVLAARQDNAQSLKAEDFLQPDGHGLRALDILAAQGRLAGLFDAALWYRAPQEAEKLHAALQDFRAAAFIDMPALRAEMHRCELQDLAPAPETFRLGRRRGPRP